MRSRPRGVWLLLFACWLSPVLAWTAPRNVEEQRYQEGTALLDRGRFSAAASAFDDVARRRGPRAPGALYWKAYALFKEGRSPAALAALDELARSYRQSSWLDDAEALRTEIRLAGNLAVDPAAQTTDESMLLALSSLIHTDPERVARELETFLEGDASPALKEQALLLLAQITSPRARQLLVEIAHGMSQPDLQLPAIKHLGSRGSRENREVLEDVYRSASRTEVKESVLRSYMIAADLERLFEVARGERDPVLRRSAIQWLGSRRAGEQLRRLYASSPQDRQQILAAMAAARQLEDLARIAGDGQEVHALRLLAVRHLGSLRGMDAGRQEKALTTIYGTETDRQIRRAAIEGLVIQRRAKALADIARRERDSGLRNAAVQGLARIGSRETVTERKGEP